MALFQPILDLAKNAQGLGLTVEYIMQELFKDKRLMQYIISLNTNEQLYDEGIDSTGKSLGEYSNKTVVIKREKGQITDHVTLKDTGAFYESFRIILTSDKDFQITANPIKDSTDLLEKYGTNVLGLTDESLGRFIDACKPKIIQIVRKKLKLAA